MKNKLRLFIFVLATITAAGSANAQLAYSSSNATVGTFSTMKLDTTFVNNTLLNLGSFYAVPDFDGQVHSFNYGGLTFNNIPNLDPTSPSDLQVGGGFFADVIFLGKDSMDNNNFGSESSLLGLSNQVLFSNYGASSNLTWRITAANPTDLIFWHQDTSADGIKYAMNDVNHWTTFVASDIDWTYYIFGIDDRGQVSPGLQDFDDGVFGVRINNTPVGIEITPVPEPGTYGILAASSLLGLVYFRRIKQKATAL